MRKHSKNDKQRSTEQRLIFFFFINRCFYTDTIALLHPLSLQIVYVSNRSHVRVHESASKSLEYPSFHSLAAASFSVPLPSVSSASPSLSGPVNTCPVTPSISSTVDLGPVNHFLAATK